MSEKFEDLVGLVLKSVTLAEDNSEIVFEVDDGRKFSMSHDQDCCEHVRVEDVAGDLQDLVGNPILRAEERVNDDDPAQTGESSTWTFYELATIKGSVTIRWLGESNGYYSEGVSFGAF